MKRSVTLAAIVAAALSASALSAIASTEMQVENTNIRAYHLGNKAIRDHGGQYRMEDGTVLRVFKEGSRFYAELDDQSRVELRAVSDSKFVTASGKTEVRFVGEAEGKVVIGRAGAAGAQMATVAQSTTSIQ
jgi:hypothetical protein